MLAAYHLDSESLGIFAFFYFVLGGFVSATFTGIVYCLVTRKECRAAGITFGQHCRNVAGWPTLSIICSWITSARYTLMFKDWLLWSDSNIAHAIFFALAPIAVFSPLWVYLIYRKTPEGVVLEDMKMRGSSFSRHGVRRALPRFDPHSL